MRLTENFSKKEFDSKDGSVMPLDVLKQIKLLACQLQTLRDLILKPIKINSGYRSIKHNKAIGGVKNSQHVNGNASDIVVEGIEPNELADIIETLISKGVMLQGGIGIYKTFVHYDIRGHKARWDNRN